MQVSHNLNYSIVDSNLYFFVFIRILYQCGLVRALKGRVAASVMAQSHWSSTY